MGPLPSRQERGGYLTNGYRYIALNPALVLTTNTAYILEAQVFSASGDGWPDVSIPGSWNPYFVGTNGPTTRQARFSSVWGANPSSTSSVNGLYGAPNLATLAIGAPIVTMLDTNVTTYAGSNVTLRASVIGQSPVTVQWYKAPNTLLVGQTNLSLTLSNLIESQSGDYYVVATNPDPGSPVQGSSATLTVLANTAPIITEQPVAKTIYVNQQTTFSVTAIGRQPLSYVWTLNGTPVPEGTNNVLPVTGASAAKAGNYSVQIVNSLGMTNSDSVSLTVLNPVATSYSAAVLNANPLVYYQFNEVAEPTTVTFNLGSLGVAADGLYEGSYAAAAGPQPPAFPNFESTNQATFMDRDGFGVSSADVLIPSLNLPTNGPAFYTLAAWINPSGIQTPYAGIIFNRGSTGANGLGIKTSPAGVDVLEYHWNNTYFAFDTAMPVPANQWTFAALVIEPTQATFYLYDGTTVQTTNNIAPHTAVPLDQVSYVGWDSAGGAGGRRFYGLIDEPMIFARALSAAELDSIYASSIHPTVQLNASFSGGNLILSWPSGILQRASDVAGPYIDAPTITSPYTNAPSGTKEFYRIKVQ